MCPFQILFHQLKSLCGYSSLNLNFSKLSKIIESQHFLRVLKQFFTPFEITLRDPQNSSDSQANFITSTKLTEAGHPDATDLT